MSKPLSDTTKYAIGTCVILGAATVAASVIVGNSFGKLVTAGFNGAKKAIKKEFAAQKKNAEFNENSARYLNVSAVDSCGTIKNSKNIDN